MSEPEKYKIEAKPDIFVILNKLRLSPFSE
jgi:hypothetical protein